MCCIVSTQHVLPAERQQLSEGPGGGGSGLCLQPQIRLRIRTEAYLESARLLKRRPLEWSAMIRGPGVLFGVLVLPVAQLLTGAALNRSALYSCYAPFGNY